MTAYTKHRPTDCEAPSWASCSVKLSDFHLGDSRNKLADAIHNTSDDDLVFAFGETNRLIMHHMRSIAWLPQFYRSSKEEISREIEHHQMVKNLMESELCIRLRSGRGKGQTDGILY